MVVVSAYDGLQGAGNCAAEMSHLCCFLREYWFFFFYANIMAADKQKCAL